MDNVLKDGLPPLRDIIARYDLGAKKSLGQNFLLDFNLIAKIARSAGSTSDGTVIEVGPGPGGLTRSLLWHGARHLIVIEKDKRCLPVLNEIAEKYPGRLEMYQGDALHMDLSTLGKPPRQIIANLPYNIATPLLIKWLEQAPAFSSLILMMQKEVVERLIAQPKTKAYGRLSILTQQAAQVKRLFDVHPRAFMPMPKVVSSVVSIQPYARPPYPCHSKTLQRVTEAAFGQRRKMLRQSLRKMGNDAELHSLFTQLSIDPTSRAEELSIQQFASLARALENR